MTHAEALKQCDELAAEIRELAVAFRPAASEGAVVRIPTILIVRLCELLESSADALKKVVDGQASKPAS